MSEARETFLGLPLDPVTQQSIVDAVDRNGDRGSLFHASLNAAKVVAGQDDSELRAAMWRFDFVTADGQPIVWAARLLGRRVPERVAGIDLMHALLTRAAEREWRVYLLGAKADVLARASREILRLHPGLTVGGSHHGYFPAEEESRVVEDVRRAAADLLFVALGSPEKELFLDRHRNDLDVRFAMGVGGAFDVVAGLRSRAPAALQKIGFEWAYRLAQEPRRLGPRYALTNRQFVALVGRELVAKRRDRASRAGPE